MLQGMRIGAGSSGAAPTCSALHWEAPASLDARRGMSAMANECSSAYKPTPRPVKELLPRLRQPRTTPSLEVLGRSPHGAHWALVGR
jgi:hypothetical protein